jgi:hypothetical protein
MKRKREEDKTMLLDDRSPPRRCSAPARKSKHLLEYTFFVWVFVGVFLANNITLSMPLLCRLCTMIGAGVAFGFLGLWLMVVCKR